MADIWINGQWQPIAISHLSLTDIGTLTHAQLETALASLAAIAGTGSTFALYPLADTADGKIYKLISENGIIGVEEVASLEVPNLITDTTDGKTRKIVSENGVIGLEEI